LSRKIGSAKSEIQYSFFNLDGNTPEILILQQLDIVQGKQFTVMHSELKHVSGPMIIEKNLRLFMMKIIDKCTFSDCWLQSHKRLPEIPERNLVILCTV
jgi:hypothetical protein